MTTKLSSGWKPSRCGTTASTPAGEPTRTRGLAPSGPGRGPDPPQAGGGLRSSRTGAGAVDSWPGGVAGPGGKAWDEPGSSWVRGTGSPDGCVVFMTSDSAAGPAENEGHI